MIKAPFNFVPLSDKFFSPKWANQISHDIPFEDGVSGTINLKITAESPLFVRNGHTQRDSEEKNEEYKSFSKTSDGKYFIPATSIKGAIRNVLEIISFGKMTHVQDRHFGLRDLDDREGYRKKMNANKIHCGWLMQKNESYIVEDCGSPKRITIKEVDEVLNNHFNLKTDLFGLVSNPENFKNDNGRDAMLKYRHIISIQNPKFSSNEIDNFLLESDDYILSDDEVTLVLTGQPGARYFDKDATKPIPSKKEIEKYGKNAKVKGCWKGKGKEFLFPNKVLKTINVDNVIESFKTIHANTPDFEKLWSKKLRNGKRVPVFFLYEDKNSIHSMGLSFMYKYPYLQSVYDAIPNNLKDQNNEGFKPDLAECMFGYIHNEEDQNSSLRGRVQFYATTPKQQVADREVTVALNSPKPSYYPLYKRGYDWNSGTDIAGRKIYMRWERPCPQSSSDNTNINSIIKPLKEQSWFETKICFSNLKPSELGALLAAISFLGDNGKKYKHSLGQGKPYGYGICKFEVTGGNLFHNNDLENKENELSFYKQVEYMKAFLNELNKEGIDLYGSETVKTLFAIAGTKQKVQGDVYMRMSKNRNENEFLLAKKNGEYLKKYPISDVNFPDLDDLLNRAHLEEEKRNAEIEKTRIEQQKEQMAKDQMQSIKLNDKVEVRYKGSKKAQIISPVEIDFDIQLVISKFEPEPAVGSVFSAVVAQVSKEGKVTQLKRI